MQRIADYDGGLLSHLNCMYRPDDRELALELVGALGLTAEVVAASRSGIIAVHPNAADKHGNRNVFYLARMEPKQVEADALLQRKMAADPELKACIESYRESARVQPDAHAHFGVMFQSDDELVPVLDTLQNKLSPALKDRVTVREMPPHPPVAGLVPMRQVFVYTDVFTVGTPAYGQLIELQVERRA